MTLRVAAAGGLLMLAVAPSPGSAAGLFDMLFGAAPPPAPVAPADSALTVHPRSVPAHPRKSRAAKTEIGRPVDHAIDPVREPDWYLKDRTLRRGDIVVLKREVLVFIGSRDQTGRPEDFAQLQTARGVPERTRDVVTKATAANAYTAVAAAPAKPVPKPKTRRPT